MEESDKSNIKFETVGSVAKSMFYYTSGSIFGPLIFFVGIGYELDKWLGKKPLFMMVGILLAFILTNILIFKRLKKLTEAFKDTKSHASDKKNEDVSKQKISNEK